jgi:hypothetical protein
LRGEIADARLLELFENLNRKFRAKARLTGSAAPDHSLYGFRNKPNAMSFSRGEQGDAGPWHFGVKSWLRVASEIVGWHYRHTEKPRKSLIPAGHGL